MTGPSRTRPAWVEVDVGAIRHNVSVLAALAAPAALCAVVKADGYGHGAVAAARAAVEGGARWLAVATVDEGVVLREAGLAVPVLLLSEPAPEAMDEAYACRLVPTLYSEVGIAAARQAAARGSERSAGAGRSVPRAGGAAPPAGQRDARHTPAPAAGRAGDGAGVSLWADGRWPVHVKVDTGMHRVGCDPSQLPEMLAAVADAPALMLGGLWTHLAVADGASDEDRAFTAQQLDRFGDAVSVAHALGMRPPLRHAANSAAVMAHPASRFDLVRCGIACYGLAPGPDLAGAADSLGLRPALSWRAQVTHVRQLGAGERPSYGRARALPEAATVAVVPLGYADGVPRATFGAGGTVLVGGRRRPLAGVVTMDQIVVDCGPEPAVVRAGDEVVLIGRQGGTALTAWDWARTLGTIAYEIVCGIGPRVPRLLVDDDRAVVTGHPLPGSAPPGSAPPGSGVPGSGLPGDEPPDAGMSDAGMPGDEPPGAGMSDAGLAGAGRPGGHSPRVDAIPPCSVPSAMPCSHPQEVR